MGSLSSAGPHNSVNAIPRCNQAPPEPPDRPELRKADGVEAHGQGTGKGCDLPRGSDTEPCSSAQATVGTDGGGPWAADGSPVVAPSAQPKKFVPLTVMAFFGLFGYTILVNTKDVIMVTAPKSGAEVLPFLKTYVQLPGAVLWTLLLSKLSNSMSPVRVFHVVVTGFLCFFALFAAVVYPARGLLHPEATADALAARLPASFMAPIAIFRNWTFSLFYFMAESWGTVVVSTLFWGLANQICTVPEARRHYPLLGLISNVAPILAGQYGQMASRPEGPAGADTWGASLRWLMGGVVASAGVLLAGGAYIERAVLPDPACVDPGRRSASRQRTRLSLRASAALLAKSGYVRSLALLVVCHGVSITIVETAWKGRLKARYPDPNGYSAFMSAFSSATGLLTLLLMLVSRQVFRRLSWGAAAAITPCIVGGTGAVFFSLLLAPSLWERAASGLGATPLALAVLVGAAQNSASKAAKYALFDPCKEMAYIPLGAEARTKGKAAIDVIGNPLGKSGGSFIQQGLIFACGSLDASTPVLGVVLCAVIGGWLAAARTVHRRFEAALAAAEAAPAPEEEQRLVA